MKRSRSVRTIKKVIRKKKLNDKQVDSGKDDVYGVGQDKNHTYEVTTIKIERDGSRSVKSVDNVRSPHALEDYNNSMILLQNIKKESHKEFERARNSIKDLRLPRH